VDPSGVVLVATSPRTPPGLLSWPAWEALRSAPVLVGEPAHPQLPWLQAAGVVARLQPPADPAQRAVDLHARAAAGERVVWLLAEGDDALVRALGELAVRRPGVPVELVHGSYDPPGARLLDVVAVLDRLRSPGGCPWDAAQTHTSLMPYLLEEAYEAYAALEDGDPDALREELGDVLLQVVLHARLAQEAGNGWSVDDVAGDLVDKLVRRHPHVFAGAAADDLEGSWEVQKAAEKGRTSVTDGIPLGQPALSLAAKLQRRAGRLGAPVPAYDGLGGRLWELAREAGAAGLDPEAELRKVSRRYRDELAGAERAARAEGLDPGGLDAAQWRSRWAAS